MTDFILMALFLGCLISTIGLVRICAWLRPRDAQPEAGRTPAQKAEEAR